MDKQSINSSWHNVTQFFNYQKRNMNQGATKEDYVVELVLLFTKKPLEILSAAVKWSV